MVGVHRKTFHGISVLDHVVSLLAEMDLRYQQRYDAQTKALDAAFLAQQAAVQAALLAQEKAVATALLAADRAVTKAEIATEKRIEGLNELRGIVQDVGALQMPRSEAEQRLSAVSEKIDELKTGANLGQGRTAGTTALIGYLIAAAAVVVAIVSLITR
jgi:hypothetical protein